jgi:hypothetical protein
MPRPTKSGPGPSVPSGGRSGWSECNGTVGTFLAEGRWIGLSTAFVLRPDGAWGPSKYGEARVRRGLPARSGGHHDLAVTFAQLSHEVDAIPSLPAKVECPECHQLRLLDADRLGVDRPPDEATRRLP